MVRSEGEYDPRVADRAARNWMLAWVGSAVLWLAAVAASPLTAMNIVPALVVQGTVLAAFAVVAVRRGRGESRGAAIACICTYTVIGPAVLAAFAPRAVLSTRLIVVMWIAHLAFAARVLVSFRRARPRSPAAAFFRDRHVAAGQESAETEVGVLDPQMVIVVLIMIVVVVCLMAIVTSQGLPW